MVPMVPRYQRNPHAVGLMLSRDDVTVLQARVKASLDSIQSFWSSCAAMPGDPIQDQWKAMRDQTEAYLANGVSWWFWNWTNEWDTGQSLLSQLEAWRQRFAALPACAGQTPPPATPAPPTPTSPSIFGDITTPLLIVAAVYLLKDKR